MEQERIDEALELLWVLDEEGHHDLKRFNLSSDDADIDAVVEVLSIEGLADLSDGEIKLTDKETQACRKAFYGYLRPTEGYNGGGCLQG